MPIVTITPSQPQTEAQTKTTPPRPPRSTPEELAAARKETGIRKPHFSPEEEEMLYQKCGFEVFIMRLAHKQLHDRMTEIEKTTTERLTTFASILDSMNTNTIPTDFAERLATLEEAVAEIQEQIGINGDSGLGAPEARPAPAPGM